MRKFKYWPLDYNPEGEIYDSPAWDLPGFRRERPVRTVARSCHQSSKPRTS